MGCTGSQFLDPDGWFPNHVPNPEDKTAMAAGVQAVQQSSSDLGVVLDTDVDRSAVVAKDGQPINSNRYIALMSLITLRSALASVTLILHCLCVLDDTRRSILVITVIEQQPLHCPHAPHHIQASLHWL